MSKCDCMKQLFILFALIVGYSASAQLPSYSGVKKAGFSECPLHKTAMGPHDSLFLHNLGAADSEIYMYSFDDGTGLVSGANSFGYYGFAERYNYSGGDSAVTFLGIAAVFVGKVSPASTKVLQLKVWNSTGKKATSSPHLFYSGLPELVAANSLGVSYTDLGISDTAVQVKQFYFPAVSSVSDTFYVGAMSNYTWEHLDGDTIGVATTKVGNRTDPIYTVSGDDTIINVQNATLRPMDVWVDNGYDLDFKMNYWLFPIVNTRVYTAGIKRNDFTFYGNYPNPAVTNTAIKFGLAQPADVEVQVVDANGRTIKTIDKPALSIGDHLIQLSTTDMPAGNYLYVIRTSAGDGIAGKITVTK